MEGFNYSPANKNSGITWSEETFAKYIRAPMQEMPGTTMAFVGIKNEKDIADLWAYLKHSGPTERRSRRNGGRAGRKAGVREARVRSS